MNKYLKLYIITWVAVFVVSFFTAKDIPLFMRILCTAGLALVVPLLELGKKNSRTDTSPKKVNQTQSTSYTIHEPLSPQVLYRIEKGKVYKVFDAAPVYEIKGNKIYPNLSPQFEFRVENGKIYKRMDAAPFLEIKGDKIYYANSSQVAYEIHKAK